MNAYRLLQQFRPLICPFEPLERFIPSEASILDIGCGTGATASDLRRHGDVVGVDFSPLALRACASRGLGPLLRSRAEATPLADSSVDAIVAEVRAEPIAVNSMLGATMQLLAEATVLVESAGVEREAFLDALDGTVMASRFVSYKGAALRARDYAATFRMIDMRKDLDLAVSLGETPVKRVVVNFNFEEFTAVAGKEGWAKVVGISRAPCARVARSSTDTTAKYVRPRRGATYCRARGSLGGRGHRLAQPGRPRARHAAGARGGRGQDGRAGVGDPHRELGRGESAEHDGVDRAQTGTREHRDRQSGQQRHV